MEYHSRALHANARLTQLKGKMIKEKISKAVASVRNKISLERHGKPIKPRLDDKKYLVMVQLDSNKPEKKLFAFQDKRSMRSFIRECGQKLPGCRIEVGTRKPKRNDDEPEK